MVILHFRFVLEHAHRPSLEIHLLGNVLAYAQMVPMEIVIRKNVIKYVKKTIMQTLQQKPVFKIAQLHCLQINKRVNASRAVAHLVIMGILSFISV